MPEKNDIRQAFLQLTEELKRQLRYFEGLGLTEFNETHEPTLMGAMSGPDAVPAGTARPAPTEPPHATGEPPMPRKKEPQRHPDQALLFDDAVISGSPPEVELPPDETLEEIRLDMGDCTRCKLHPQRTNIVFGEGNPRAELMFIGEGPGAEEDATGRPFVGRAGRLLDRMIEAIGLRREDVYIGNVVKCRPPGNRNPEADEVATCEPFLFRQISVIQPRLVVALGAVATQTLLQTRAPISRLRGRFFDFRGTKLLPTFHPAFLLRSPNKKKEAWEDLKMARGFLRREAAD